MKPRARGTLPVQGLNARNSGNRNLKEGTHFLPQGSTPLPGRLKCGLVVSPGGEGNGLWGRASASFFPVCSPCLSEIRESRSPGQLVGGGLPSLGSLPALHHLWIPSGEPGVSGDFWGSQEGCQGPEPERLRPGRGTQPRAGLGWFPQPEGKIGLPRANPRGRLRSPS